MIFETTLCGSALKCVSKNTRENEQLVTLQQDVGW